MRIPNNLQTYRLLGAINLSSPFGLRDHRMIMLALHTGLRVSELSFLDVHHVFRDCLPRDVLDLLASLAKLHKSRRIPLNAAAQRALVDILAFNRSRGLSVDPSAPLLQNRYHRRLTVRGIQRLVQHYRELAHLDVKITPHSLRHKFATDVARATNVCAAQIILGHRDIRTTQRYLHPDLNDLIAAVAAIE
jgi:site-specific recombinase XerD